ncbi:MAG: MarR family winged helix-turn-helix transcriptional regulator [Solirubrobacteraceae bacterium]
MSVPVRVDVSLAASELRVVLGQLMRRLRAEHRFPLSHGAVLGRLDRQGPLSTVELASAERVRPQSMGQTLAELEAQGLVSRRPDEADGRRTLLELTDAGRQMLAEDRGRREGWLAQAIEREFSAEEQEVLAQAIPLLARLTEL